MRKILPIILAFAVIAVTFSAGCATQSVHQSKENIPTAITTTQSPETTFISPTNSGKTPSPATVQSPTQIQPVSDPIIGTWTLENAPYSGTVIFFEGGTGSLSVGLSMVSTKKQFAWSHIENNGNSRVYHITLAESDTVTNGTMYENGTIFSSALPDNSYLGRYR